MRCIECGEGQMIRKRMQVRHEIRGLKFEVEDTVHVCGRCGFMTIPWDRADEHGRLVDREYRRQAGILTAEEIVAARKRMGMSQREFAEYLGVGEASVKRWEKGVLLDKSSSDLIRLKTDLDAARKNYEELCCRLDWKEIEKLTIIIRKATPILQRKFTWPSNYTFGSLESEIFWIQ